MKNGSKLLIAISVTFFFYTDKTMADEPDYFMMSQNSFHSPVAKALGNAGVAHPADIASGLINPALNYSSIRYKERGGALSLGYARDTFFTKHIVPVGIEFATPEGSLAFFYRYLNGKQYTRKHEYILSISSQLSGADDESERKSGPVDFGANARYEVLSVKHRNIGPFLNRISVWDSASALKTDSVTGSVGVISNSWQRIYRLYLDIGFFQADVLPNLDFGLTLRNLFGYEWNSKAPIIRDSTKSYKIGKDSVMEQLYVYTNETLKEEGFIEKEKRLITIGLLYHLLNNSTIFHINVPVDIEIIGLLDKKIKNQYTIRCGIEGVIKDKIFLRAGYTKAPEFIKIYQENLKYSNLFSFGGGVKIDPIACDFYITKDAFGIGTSYTF
jgi:hypothetical protein